MASTARRSRGMAPSRAIAESFLPPQLSTRDAKRRWAHRRAFRTQRDTLIQQKPRSGSEMRLDMAHEMGLRVSKRERKGRRDESKRCTGKTTALFLPARFPSGVWGNGPGPGATEPLHDELWINRSSSLGCSWFLLYSILFSYDAHL